ncbi:hypothetical protein BM536_017285 [Streptomyces phaeoluteigriseus]|uniref:Uncharacterized protein n=1 Tax=Streptomyces phaeoluteigriseus TaxID=114686 RepID=A0A1V6MSC8_9ACTN|nr:hypothetical protein [Streptomyces phaeoluteigriseus]OQD55206.1 hypothetical protein BM536_017285 [Streptomyces phaeoluteigriseus]
MMIADDEQRGGTAGLARTPGVVELLENTDWASLAHAYGPAEDTPAHLVHLLDEDPRRQAEALGMLDMSVLHQGSLYSATPAAMLFIAAVLPHPPRTLAVHESYHPWDDRTRPLRAALLEFLGLFAESAAYGEEPGGGGDRDGGVPAGGGDGVASGRGGDGVPAGGGDGVPLVGGGDGVVPVGGRDGVVPGGEPPGDHRPCGRRQRRDPCRPGTTSRRACPTPAVRCRWE